MQKIKKTMRGFTLIELLVVIAIIGLLASIVLVSLSSARRKARDARRVGDLRQIQLALELYFDDKQQYPADTTVIATTYTPGEAVTLFEGDLSTALVPTYVGGMPRDPTDSTTNNHKYGYVAGDNTASGTENCNGTEICLHYILEVDLEDSTHLSLKNDNDETLGGFTVGGYDCRDTAASPTYCVGA